MPKYLFRDRGGNTLDSTQRRDDEAAMARAARIAHSTRKPVFVSTGVALYRVEVTNLTEGEKTGG